MFGSKTKRLFLTGLFVLQFSLWGFSSDAMEGGSRVEAPSVKSQVAKILLSSLGGAVLGISTLSFYETPQDHLSNVAIGGAIGILLGSMYVTNESLNQKALSTFESGGTVNLAFLSSHTKSSKTLDGVGISWSFVF